MDYFLIRHTKPDIDAGVCYGRLDINVASTFASEVAAILQTLDQEKNIPGTTIYASPLKRCRLLAESLAAKYGCTIIFDDRLRELNFGDWEGKRWDKIDRVSSDFWTADVWQRAPPGGETYRELYARVAAFFTDLARLQIAQNPPQTQTIIVSHGGPLRAALSWLLHEETTIFPAFNIGLASVSKVSLMKMHGGKTAEIVRALENAQNAPSAHNTDDAIWTLQYLSR